MLFSMYLPDNAREGCFVITNEENQVVLETAPGDAPASWKISEPSAQFTLLSVRCSSFGGESIVFSDATGTRGTYHVRRYDAAVTYRMLNGRWETQYRKKDGTVSITRRGRRVALARLLPEYRLYFEIDMAEPSELLFTAGSLLAVTTALR